MKAIKYFTLVTFPIVLLIFFAGVIRTDVSIDKYIRLGKKKQLDCVGMVTRSDLKLVGSCVLIDSNYVLTAAHIDIVEDFEKNQKPVYCIFNGKSYQVSSVIIHPGYDPKGNPFYADLAVLKLEKPVFNIKPAVLYTGMNELHSVATLAGYGPVSLSNSLKPVLSNAQRIAGNNVIDSIGGPYNPDSNIQSLLITDMDVEGGEECCNTLGDAKPLPLEFVTSAGDSGGGLFLLRGGKWQLAGITKSGGPYLLKWAYGGSKASYTRIAAFKAWIYSQIKRT